MIYSRYKIIYNFQKKTEKTMLLKKRLLPTLSPYIYIYVKKRRLGHFRSKNAKKMAEKKHITHSPNILT